MKMIDTLWHTRREQKQGEEERSMDGFSTMHERIVCYIAFVPFVLIGKLFNAASHRRAKRRSKDWRYEVKHPSGRHAWR